MRIYQQQKRLITNWFTFGIERIGRIAAQQHAETAHERGCPFFFGHLVTAGSEPHHIPNLGARNAATFQKRRPQENRMLFSQLDQFSRELKKPILLLVTMPVEPTTLVVLAISIVISALGSPQLVSAAKHRHPLRQKQSRQEIPALPIAQSIDLRIFGWSFHPAIPRQIIVVAVAIIVAVQLVVFFVVADQIT